MFDMWLVLKGDQHNGVTKRNVLVFLFAILGLKFEIEKEEKSKADMGKNNPKIMMDGI